jgi:hypothetical protein
MQECTSYTARTCGIYSAASYRQRYARDARTRRCSLTGTLVVCGLHESCNEIIYTIGRSWTACVLTPCMGLRNSTVDCRVKAISLFDQVRMVILIGSPFCCQGRRKLDRRYQPQSRATYFLLCRSEPDIFDPYRYNGRMVRVSLHSAQRPPKSTLLHLWIRLIPLHKPDIHTSLAHAPAHTTNETSPRIGYAGNPALAIFFPLWSFRL